MRYEMLPDAHVAFAIEKEQSLIPLTTPRLADTFPSLQLGVAAAWALLARLRRGNLNLDMQIRQIARYQCTATLRGGEQNENSN